MSIHAGGSSEGCVLVLAVLAVEPVSHKLRVVPCRAA
jgi:hypothetical protein